MVINNKNQYAIYPASEIENIDMSLFFDRMVWNNDNSRFLVEFIEPQITGFISFEEAKTIVRELDWIGTDFIP